MTAPIFIISLKNSPRGQQIQSQFKKYDIPFTLFDAVDGRQGLPPEYEQMVDRELAYNRIYRYLSDGEIACALSHHFVYKHILDNNIEHAIIMEDDAILTDDFKTFIDNTVYKKCGADIVFLYHYGAFVSTEYKSYYNSKYYTLKNTPGGGVAYYITAPVAQALYTASSPICYTADFPIDLTNTFNVQAIYPRIIQHPKQSNHQSTLEKDRNHVKAPENKSLMTRFLIKWQMCQTNKFCISPYITGNQVTKYNAITFVIHIICFIWEKVNNKIWQKK